MSAPEDPRKFRYFSKIIFIAVVFALFWPALLVKAAAATRTRIRLCLN